MNRAGYLTSTEPLKAALAAIAAMAWNAPRVDARTVAADAINAPIGA
ncbi:hypothetical protein [Cellulomonas sp. NPDC089187]